MEYQKGTSQYLQILVLDKLGAPVTGLNPDDVTIMIYRDSDGAYLDSVSGLFVLSGGDAENNTTELNTLGIYRFLFDQSIDTTDNETYTIVYSVKQPYVTSELEAITFRDVNLDDIKGIGWDSASVRPTLMNLANKDANYSYNNAQHSLEKQSEDGTVSSGENFNSSPL